MYDIQVHTLPKAIILQSMLLLRTQRDFLQHAGQAVLL